MCTCMLRIKTKKKYNSAPKDKFTIKHNDYGAFRTTLTNDSN